jgi:hypothetical protein
MVQILRLAPRPSAGQTAGIDPKRKPHSYRLLWDPKRKFRTRPDAEGRRVSGQACVQPLFIHSQLCLSGYILYLSIKQNWENNRGDPI